MPQLDKFTYFTQFFWSCLFLFTFYIPICNNGDGVLGISRILKLRNQLVSRRGNNIRSNDLNSLEDILTKGATLGVSYIYSFFFEVSQWNIDLFGKGGERTLISCFGEISGSQGMERNILFLISKFKYSTKNNPGWSFSNERMQIHVPHEQGLAEFFESPFILSPLEWLLGFGEIIFQWAEGNYDSIHAPGDDSSGPEAQSGPSASVGGDIDQEDLKRAVDAFVHQSKERVQQEPLDFDREIKREILSIRLYDKMVLDDPEKVVIANMRCHKAVLQALNNSNREQRQKRTSAHGKAERIYWEMFWRDREKRGRGWGDPNSPLDQFSILPLIPMSFYLSFTNPSLFMLLTLSFVLLLVHFVTKKGGGNSVPNAWLSSLCL